MKTKVKVKREVDLKFLQIDVGPRYWEDTEVNGVEDAVGDLIPFKENDRWKLTIDIDNGIIVNWPKGTMAKTHYKVCDDGHYKLLDENSNIILEKEDYVPNMMPGEHFGDYLILDIDENGVILNWKKKFSIKDFHTNNDEEE